jgi:hypothetical protein
MMPTGKYKLIIIGVLTGGFFGVGWVVEFYDFHTAVYKNPYATLRLVVLFACAGGIVGFAKYVWNLWRT